MGITGIAWDRDEWVAAKVMFSTDTSKCGGKFSRANVTVLLFLKCEPGDTGNSLFTGFSITAVFQPAQSQSSCSTQFTTQETK